ncbi:MAG: DUF4974 domain-containing protein [Bacteroidetes bacterium]|nr:MAG: DUF4974 domain-containing protein [Bacteroidota bacterium]
MDSNIYNLVAKKLANQCNADEELEFEAWVSLNNTNRETYNEFEKLWHNTTETAIEIDVDKAWQKVSERTAPKTFKLPTHFMRYAAAIAVFVMLGFWAITTLRIPTTLIQTASNELKQVELPDGSKVWLHEYAKLSFKNNLKGDKRELTLEGLAFFEVKRDTEHPFIISTPHGEVEVLGTSFEVSAYKNEPFERVTVRSGKVKFKQQSGNFVVLTANQQAIYNNTGALDSATVQAESLVSWIKGELEFEDDKMDKVVEKIARYFHVKIKLENTEIANCHFTGSFKKPSLKEVLEVVCKTLSLEQSKQGETIIIKGKGCEPSK